MRLPTYSDLTELLSAANPPCISLFQTTHRTHPDNQQDSIRFGNLLKQLEEALGDQYRSASKSYLKQLHDLEEDRNFWQHRSEGLAIFCSPEKFKVFELQQEVPELVVVAESFHVKPLLRELQSADRYEILALGRGEAKLYVANRYAIDAVEVEGMPSTLEEALGSELTEPHLTVASYGDGAGGPGMHHGHGGRKAEIDIDRDRFFRVIDRALLERNQEANPFPLMLAALPEYHEPFRSISRNAALLEQGVEKDPASMKPEQLRDAAWEVVRPLFQGRQAQLSENFHTALAQQMGSEDLSQIAAAAAAGRIATLFVEAGRQEPGRIESASGKISRAKSQEAGVDDLLDDLAETVLQMNGEVAVLAKEQMPTKTGAAAIYRY